MWRQKPIDNFIVDFYCPQLKLVIEVDGAGHFTEQGKAYDRQRTKILEGYGLRVIRFTNDEVLDNIEGVWERICSFIPPNPHLEDCIPPNPPLEGGDWRGDWSIPLATGYEKDNTQPLTDRKFNSPLNKGGWGGLKLNKGGWGGLEQPLREEEQKS
jgi:hypothetical protein